MTFPISRIKKLEPKQSIRGAGDAVALVAKPVARVIDRFFKTHLENCQACAERQKKLNEMFHVEKG